MSDLMNTTHADTTRQSIHETVRQLNQALGTTAVSFLADAKDRKQAGRWAKSDGAEPRPATKKRLLAAHRAWQILVLSEGEYVARNWFVGANPRLAERSPLEALREGEGRQVILAAGAFADGTDG